MTVRRSAAVILHRDGPAGPEVFLARRAPGMKFMGGFFAFPGGGLDSKDGAGEDALERCARREIAEEIGVDLDAAPLTPLCTFLTPPFGPLRHETRFFLARVPADAKPEVRGGELVEGAFFTASRALRRWRESAMPIAPPVLLLLEWLDAHGLARLGEEAERATARFREGALPPVRFSPGIVLAPLRTPTLPPATTTNTIVAGTERLVVVDPGTPEPDEQARLAALVEERVAAGAVLDAVVLTHHHPDHVGGVAALCERFGVPVRAHAATLERVATPRLRGAPIAEGDVLDLGTAPAGSGRFALEAIFTPGHARGHLAFLERGTGALLAGDLLSTLSTIVIDPPEGHMATYLATLRRVRDLPARIVYPAHGPPALYPPAVFGALLSHRRAREAKLVEALARGIEDEDVLLREVYADVDPRLLPVAARSLRAGLEKLEEEGAARRTRNGWTGGRRVGDRHGPDGAEDFP